MEILLDLLQTARGAVFAIRDYLDAHNLYPVYRALRYVLSVEIVVLCLIPVLLLSRWRPARPDEPLLSRQLLLDYCYPVFSLLIASFFIGIGVTAVHDFYGRFLPWANLKLVDQLPFAAQVVIAFLVQDFLRYASHFMRHKVPWFWHFHAIHHSQTVLNPATTHRTHPLEGVIGALVTALPIGILGGAPLAWIYAGITGQFWDMFIHANVRTNLGVVGRALVSPQFHRVHHSIMPEHFDRNFGERLVVWDWMFGTMCKDRDVYPPTGVLNAEGLVPMPAGPAGIARAWLRHLAYPFRMIARSAGGRTNMPWLERQSAD